MYYVLRTPYPVAWGTEAKTAENRLFCAFAQISSRPQLFTIFTHTRIALDIVDNHSLRNP